MRLAIFSSDEQVFLLPAWRQLISQLSAEHELAGVWLFPDIAGKHRGLGVLWWYLRTYGLWTVIKLALKSLPARFSMSRAFRTFCAQREIPLRYGDNPNDGAVVKWLEEQQIDVLMISVGFILRKKTIQAVRKTVLNKHSSLLPAYRGLLPVFWTMYDGQVPIGLTIHRVDEKIDNGEILVQKAFPDFSGSMFDAYKLLHHEAPSMFLEALEALQNGHRTVVESPPRQPCYHTLPTRDDVRRFRARDLKLV